MYILFPASHPTPSPPHHHLIQRTHGTKAALSKVHFFSDSSASLTVAIERLTRLAVEDGNSERREIPSLGLRASKGLVDLGLEA